MKLLISYTALAELMLGSKVNGTDQDPLPLSLLSPYSFTNCTIGLAQSLPPIIELPQI